MGWIWFQKLGSLSANQGEGCCSQQTRKQSLELRSDASDDGTVDLMENLMLLSLLVSGKPRVPKDDLLLYFVAKSKCLRS
ncbi:hypothetical protein ACFX2G_018474 [Malus domestica]